MAAPIEGYFRFRLLDFGDFTYHFSEYREGANMKPSITTARRSTRHSAKTEAYLEMIQQRNRHHSRRRPTQNISSLSVQDARQKNPEVLIARDNKNTCPTDELPIFGHTVSELNPLVIIHLQELIPQLGDICADVDVKVVHNGGNILLEGDWQRLCKASTRLTQLLQTVPLMEADPVKSPNTLLVDKGQEDYALTYHITEHLKRNNLNPAEEDVQKIIEPPMEVSISENTNTSETTIAKTDDENFEIPKDPKISNDGPVSQGCTSSAFSGDSVFCFHCDAIFATTDKMRKHFLEDHASAGKNSSKWSLQPDGELTEVFEQTTYGFKVMIDARHVEWYQCTMCPMIGSRRFRMAEHYRVSHLENCDMPFKVIAKPDGGSMVGTVDEVRLDGNVSGSSGETVVKAQLSRFQRLHPEMATEACVKCGYRTSASGMRTHMRLKHTKYLYCCQVCERSFSTLFLLRKHFRGHGSVKGANTVKQLMFECDKCGRRFSRKVDMVHHKQLGQSCSDEGPPDSTKYNPLYVDGNYSCGVCGYVAKQRVHVVQHHARRHAPKEFCCSQCTQTFAYERDLQNHMMVSHATEKTHKCDECGKCFASMKYLLTHKLRHKKVKKHFCSICNKGFLEKYRMSKHYETHKDRRERLDLHYCGVCKKGFSSDAYRKDHENIHTGLEPYSCKICGKTLKAAGHMWKHMQYYHTKKMHACPQPACKKSFRFKSGLKAHLVTHTGEGEHRCLRCGKVYTQRQTLLKHVCKAPAVTTTASHMLKDAATKELCAAEPTVDITLGSPVAQQNVYMCSECSKIFYEWDEINQHMQMHVTIAELPQEALLEPENRPVQIQVLDVPDEAGGDEHDKVTTAILNMAGADQIVNPVSDANNAQVASMTGVQQEVLASSQVWTMLVNPINKDFSVDESSSVVFVDNQPAVQLAKAPDYDQPEVDIIQQDSLIEDLS